MRYALKECIVYTIIYYNVNFYLRGKSSADEWKIDEWLSYVENNAILMNDIDCWCCEHKIEYWSQYYYRKDYGIKENIWNLYSYLRWLITKRWRKYRRN